MALETGLCLGRRIQITFDDESDSAQSTPAPSVTAPNPGEAAKRRSEAAVIPIVRQAMELLDARIVEVEDDKPMST